jgi:hypothetical protein
MQERSNAHSPKEKTETCFDTLQQFLFETVLYPIVREFSSSRLTPQLICINPIFYIRRPACRAEAERRRVGDAEWARKNVAVYRVKKLTTVCTALLVPLTVLCATFFAVIAVFFATCRAERTGPA